MHGETLPENATMPDAVHGQLDRHVRRPAQDWMRDVAPGQMLRIKPLWNNTERGPNCIPVPCKVLAVQLGVHGCQSGALFTVRTKGGNERTLDAGWFQPPNVELTGAARHGQQAKPQEVEK